MSFRVINDVTRALATFIESQVKPTVPTASVSLLPPGDTLPQDTGINLYLYRIHECPFTRNDPWRGDRTHPPLDKPPLGLQLHYLLTPLGKKSEASAQAGDVAHTLLGIAMLALHEHPVLNDIHVPGFDADAVLSNALLDSYEDVKVILSPVSVEDLSKIWATINQPYRLSVAYEVSLVELVPDQKPPVNAGVVQETNLTIFTLDPPRVDALSPASGALARLVGGAVTANTLTMTGSSLGRPDTQPIVRIGGNVVELASPAIAPFTSLTVTLPADLDAGPQVDVRVSVAGKRSQPATFTVSPWLVSITPLRTALDTASPTIALTGQDLTANPQVRYEGPVGTRTVNATTTGGVLRAPIPTDLTNGIYDVRAQLGGGQLSNGRTLEVIPNITGTPTITVTGGKHRIAIAGARLAGSQLALIVDGVAYQLGANANATALTFTFQRLLATGEHTLAVDVDGSRSHTVSFTVT